MPFFVEKSDKSARFDKVIIHGPNLQQAWLSYAKMRERMHLYACNSHQEIIDTEKQTISSGDLILFKASHSSELRQVISKLWPREYSRVNHAERDPYIEWIEQVKNS